MRTSKLIIEVLIIAVVVALVLLLSALFGSIFTAVPILGLLGLGYIYTSNPERGWSVEKMEADLRDCEDHANRLREAIEAAKREFG